MSSSKKGGLLYRITVSFTMNDDGCSIPELRIVRDRSTEVNEKLRTGFPPFDFVSDPIHIGDLNQHQSQAVLLRLKLAADGWVQSLGVPGTYEPSHDDLVKFVKYLQRIASSES
jgi:hypothetical protein